MNQRYGCLRCMKFLLSLNKNGCFSCSEHRYFFSLKVNKSVVSAVSARSPDFPVLKHALITVPLHSRYTEARSNGPNMADQGERKIEEDKTDLML